MTPRLARSAICSLLKPSLPRIASLSCPSSGAGFADGQALRPVRDGVAEDGEVAQRGRAHRLRHLQMPHLRIGEGLVDPIDRSARHAGVVQDLDPLRARLLPGHRHEHLHHRVAVGRARPRGGEARVGAEVRALDGLAEPLVEVVAGGGDIDVAVLGLEDAGGDAGGMVVPGLRRHLLAHQPARGLEVEHGELRFQQRGVHPLALPGGLALDERHENALGEEDARAEIGDGDAHAHRPLAGNAGDGHEAAHALGDLVDAGPVAVRPALPEAGDAAVDEARVDGAQALVVDAQPPLDVRPVVLHHDVGVLGQPLEDGHALRIAEVQRQRLLAAVQVLEVEPVAVAAHAVAVAPAGHLDLDGARAPVHELAHAGGAGAGPGEVEHGVAREGQGGVVGHVARSPIGEGVGGCPVRKRARGGRAAAGLGEAERVEIRLERAGQLAARSGSPRRGAPPPRPPGGGARPRPP